MIKPEVLDALVAAGCTGEQIAAAVKADQARSSGAERQARYRARKASQNDERDVTSVTVTPDLSPKKETPPEPPKEKTTPIRETEAREFHEVFWPAYPLKRGKADALKAFFAARKRASLEIIMAGVRRYAAERAGEDPQFTKHAQGWLSGDHWTDEPVPRRQPKQAHAPPETVGSLSLKQLVNPRNDNDVTDYSERRLEASRPGGLEAGPRAAQAFTVTGDFLGRI